MENTTRRRLEETTNDDDDDEQPESETLETDQPEREWNMRERVRSLMTMEALTNSMCDSIHHLKACRERMRQIADIRCDHHLTFLSETIDAMDILF